MRLQACVQTVRSIVVRAVAFVSADDRPSVCRLSACRPSAYRPCIPLLVTLALGILAGRLTEIGLLNSCGMTSVLVLAWHFLVRRQCHRAACGVLYLALTVAAAGWSYDRWHLFAADDLSRSLNELGSPVTVDAVVRRGPRYRQPPPHQPLASIPQGAATHLLVEVRRARHHQQWRSASGTATLSVDGHVVGIHAGDQIRIHGRGSIIGPPLNPGQSDFAAHLRGQRQLCRLQASHPDAIDLIQRGSTMHPRRVLDELRRRGQVWLQRHLPPHEAGLALAVLLGVREELEEQRSDAFFQSGLAHLLAVSGLNVAIFAYGFWFIARLGLIPRRPAIVLVATLAILYAILTDADPPVLRAGLLVVGSAVGRLVGRAASGENTLAGAACLVLLVDPSSLFHAGAQLSFLAVAVLDRLHRPTREPKAVDPLDRLLARSRGWPERVLRHVAWWSWESFSTSALVWLVTLPLVWYRFHVVSPVALILNPLVMLPMTLAMYSGACALAVAGIWPWLGDQLGNLCGACLALIEVAIAQGLRVPGNHLWLPAPPLLWILSFYAGLALTVVVPHWLPPPRWRWAMLLIWLSWGFSAATGGLFLADGTSPRRTGDPRVTLIAVGHGTSVLVELPDGQNLLYDGGRLGNPAPASRAIAGVLWSKGITHLDAVVISHADTDHYNALPELSERFSIGAVYVSPVMFRESSPALESLQAALRRAGISVRRLSAGDKLVTADSTIVEVWHPPRGAAEVGSDNSHSIVLAIEHAGRRVLLPGDLESPGLDQLLSGPTSPCDVVMAPHHGSIKSNPRGFAAWTTPRFVVVSGSRNRDDPQLRRAYESAACHVLHTGCDGAVEVLLRGDGVQVRSWRRDGF